MDEFSKLINKKVKGLSEIPAKYYTAIDRLQRKIYDDILESLARLKTADNKFIKSRENMKIAAEIRNKLSQVLTGKEYMSAIMEFTSGFDTQKKMTDKYFDETFDTFKPSKVNAAIVSQSKKSAVELLTSATPQTDFLNSISTEINKGIYSGSSWRDMIDIVRNITLGNEQSDGKLLRYSKQIASDTLAIADRSYTKAIADDLDAQWFLYFGDELPTSREFCIERHGNYYHKKEVQQWASLSWSGKMKDTTNEQTIFINAGGWNCQHSIMPVTIDMVPKDDVQRNVDNGNYTLTDFDKEELGFN